MPSEKVGFVDFPEEDSTIWKYMDLPQFVSLVEDEFLYFSRIDRFDDPFEGSLTQENLKYRNLRKGSDTAEEPIGQYRKSLNQELTKYTYADCWHLNDGESMAMWDLYTTRGYGIAITTTIKQYVEMISECQSKVYVGAVDYIDYQEDHIPRYNTLAPVFHKRRSFEHENEFRGVVQDLPYFLKAAECHGNAEMLESDIENFDTEFPPGVSIDVNVDQLINQIYIAPDTPSWQASVVETITESFSNLQHDITHSSLEENPVY
ncbi:DUF2971 domain-containing protein [Natronococcus occultus]|uniref:DUF2971 domain-containing protein n=1 Tax=Natronococcus occultus SP4 TaxID=694430 RepID=L0K0G7_9EURY|nr:DUF2971 domain-containing protein [Natronococcus occultus]AGB38055.1 Protein of unknown function (DUF2971) [Natronococcus occultus SP4]